MPSLLYAHSLDGKPESEWELLDDHLACVAERAAAFAAKFGAEGWGRAVGQLHDIGKAKPGFQARLPILLRRLSAHIARSRICRVVDTKQRPFEATSGRGNGYDVDAEHRYSITPWSRPYSRP